MGAVNQIWNAGKLPAKYLAVQTRHKVWVVVERSGYSGDEPRLIKSDVRIKVCHSQEEAEGFAKLLRES